MKNYSEIGDELGEERCVTCGRGMYTPSGRERLVEFRDYLGHRQAGYMCVPCFAEKEDSEDVVI